MKTADPGVAHKSEVQGVSIGLRTPEEVRESYQDLAARLGPRVVIQAQAHAGRELALGVVRDEQFGPLVMVAAGGVLIEVLDDRRFALPPLDDARARALIDRLAIRRALSTGKPSGDPGLEGLVEAMVRLSLLAEELGEHLDALDVNPILAGPWGCLAVDALVVARGS
jgi:hypothetical protein